MKLLIVFQYVIFIIHRPKRKFTVFLQNVSILTLSLSFYKYMTLVMVTKQTLIKISILKVLKQVLVFTTFSACIFMKAVYIVIKHESVVLRKFCILENHREYLTF